MTDLQEKKLTGRLIDYNQEIESRDDLISALYADLDEKESTINRLEKLDNAIDNIRAILHENKEEEDRLTTIRLIVDSL